MGLRVLETTYQCRQLIHDRARVVDRLADGGGI